ncbi:glycosyltransferase [Agarivorans gilvus]|uniref:glycosyltransferase n=1 Tax=Agarivorans gilvus TaxID=680279 RepID=UPI000AB98DE3|nr:glycosyltransferase [Agarivorans gilvus]
MNANPPVISIICPCYNEQDTVAVFTETMLPELAKTELSYELIFINDGSRDQTLSKLKDLQTQHANIRVINLARNFGKEAALTAGIDRSKGQVVVPIDVDLQDPPS